MTSRNVYSHPLTDFFYNGLNFQIEHHLFPSMPRNKLRQAQVIIKQFCHEKGIPYYETSLVQSYREIFEHLAEMSAVLYESLTEPEAATATISEGG
jgi:fatty acid desaturase